MNDKLKSRKFWMALFGAVLPIVADYLTGSQALPEALQASIAVIISYIFGQAYVDSKVTLPADPGGES